VQKLERSEVSKFSFKQDLYWNIPVDESFNVYEEPKLTIGSNRRLGVFRKDIG